MKRASLAASAALATALFAAAPAMAEDFEACATTTDGVAARIILRADGPGQSVRKVWDDTVSSLTARQLASEQGYNTFMENMHTSPDAAITAFSGPFIGGPACDNGI